MKNNKNELKERMTRLAKKGFNLSLCALLAGGIFAGTLQGIEAVTGISTALQVSATEKPAVDFTRSESDEDEPVVKGSLDVSDIVEKTMPSVVSITTKSIEEVQSYYGFFYGYDGYAPAPQEKEVEGSGSGIIIAQSDSELLIVTNNHVVEGANTLSVTFADNETYEAKVKGTDSEKDVAVVSIPLSDLSKDTLDAISIAVIGSSDDLRVGEQVLAIGNAMGYGQSVTTGIVSAKNRRIDADLAAYSTDTDKGVNLIQTDAAINPGNSGGALMNMKGEVVGINSAKLASTDVEGMCYAIAISDVEDVLYDLMNTVTRDRITDGSHGFLGIVGQTVSDELAAMYGVPGGVFIAEVTEGGAAEAAGIKAKSIITRVDGKRVTTIDELVKLMEYYAPGEEIEIEIQAMDSDGYVEKKVTAVLGERTEDADDSAVEEEKADDEEESEDKADDEEMMDPSISGEDPESAEAPEDFSSFFTDNPEAQEDFFNFFDEMYPGFSEYFGRK